jgi:hypothetical protein
MSGIGKTWKRSSQTVAAAVAMVVQMEGGGQERSAGACPLLCSTRWKLQVSEDIVHIATDSAGVEEKTGRARGDILRGGVGRSRLVSERLSGTRIHVLQENLFAFERERKR